MNRTLYNDDLRASLAGLEDWLRGQRVLVTGATGTIGSFLVDALMLPGMDVEVYAAGRSREGMARRFGGLLDDPRFHYVPFDSTQTARFDFDVDLIVYGAVSTHPLAYSTDPVGIMKANLVGTESALEYLREHSAAKLAFLSSGEVYGENPDLPDGFRETDHGWVDPMRPRACYPESKRAAETLCAAYVAQYGVDARVARLCHTYGPTFTPSNSRADAQFLRKALNGEDIVMKSDGSQVRSWCYVADAVNGVLWLLRHGEPGQAYNVASRAIHSIREYAQTLCDIGGVSLRFDLPPDVEKAGYSKVTRAVLNPEKLESLGWRSHYDLRMGLEHTFNCLKNNG